MKRLLLAAVFATLGGCVSLPPAPPPPTPAQIVDMAKSGKSDTEIIDAIRTSRGLYELPASELVALSREGVSDAVLDHMQKTWIEAERSRGFYQARDQYFWAYSAPYYRFHPRRGWYLYHR